MTRAKPTQDSPVATSLFPGLESPTAGESGSHTTRQSGSEKLLRTLSKGFRRADDCRTLAWLAVEGIGDEVTTGEVRKRLVRWKEAVEKVIETFDEAQV